MFHAKSKVEDVQESLSSAERFQAKKMKSLRLLRWACRGIIFAATAVSVWANSLHAKSNAVSVFISIMPPLIVWAGFELTSRIPLRENAHLTIRSIRPTVTAGITTGAAYLSYFHQRDAFGVYSDEVTAAVLPLLIDGLMIIASVSLIDLNEKVRSFENLILSAAMRTSIPRAERETKVSRPKMTKKDQIVRALDRHPEMTANDVAKLTGATVNHVYAVMRELSKRKELAASA